MKYIVNLEEEVIWEHTVSRETKLLWQKQLEMLDEFERICNKYGLTYYASGGTLLGAARHQGYIPWDDDIDVHMLTADYNKFCEVAPKELREPFFWQDWRTDSSTTPKLAKIRNSATTGDAKEELENWDGKKNMGIYIDIFPISYIPDNKLKARFQKFLLHFYSSCINTYIYKFNNRLMTDNSKKMKIRRILYPLLSHTISYLTACKRFEAAYNMQTKPTKKVGALSFDHTVSGYVWDADWYGEAVELPFMGSTIKCPAEWDKCLTRQYGDWHKKAKGTSQHSGLEYDINTPYTEKLKKKE